MDGFGSVTSSMGRSAPEEPQVIQAAFLSRFSSGGEAMGAGAASAMGGGTGEGSAAGGGLRALHTREPAVLTQASVKDLVLSLRPIQDHIICLMQGVRASTLHNCYRPVSHFGCTMDLVLDVDFQGMVASVECIQGLMTSGRGALAGRGSEHPLIIVRHDLLLKLLEQPTDQV